MAHPGVFLPADFQALFQVGKGLVGYDLFSEFHVVLQIFVQESVRVAADALDTAALAALVGWVFLCQLHVFVRQLEAPDGPDVVRVRTRFCRLWNLVEDGGILQERLARHDAVAVGGSQTIFDVTVVLDASVGENGDLVSV
eukprot:CAMPEP_0168199214 /NCGR_PEP_ID=MMETSP0139_2-20121125/22276_1 /TAXON_ID=44445 /ORGANISM="Pseudo-nitzschia australis, Strain 10249 10 AB" /LENGTH=140 /DNA_ID=CAMNT_0008124133 /DNA_START=502 /DNA_END=924 /DNA_ORIENTATION=+